MEEIYKQAVSLQNKFNQYLDQPNHEIALQLKVQFQQLSDEVKLNKNPRSLEDKVKIILQLLHDGETAGVMNDRHTNELHDICMQLQQELRSLM